MKVSSLGIVVVAFLTTGTLVEIAKTKRRTTCSLFRGERSGPLTRRIGDRFMK
jgi:hypothetical protein